MSVRRIILMVIALLVLLTVYLFQQFNFLLFICECFNSNNCLFHPHIVFIVNKTIRLIINDMACVLLIIGIFKERKYLRVAWYVFILEILFILPLYFFLKLSLEGDSEISSPLLSQIHRMIVNPTLMFLLMVAFFYQKRKANKAVAS